MMKIHFIATKVIVIFLLIFCCIALCPSNVNADKYAILTIDVWTNKGGQGENVAGGSYTIGEQVIIYVKASIACQCKITWMGPSGTDSRQLQLETGKTAGISLRATEASDMGTWQVKAEARYDTQYKTDLTSFVIAGSLIPESPPPTLIIPPPEPKPVPPPALQPPAQPQPPPSSSKEPTKKIKPDNATELHALIAQKITEGLLTADPNMDVDGDGKITTEDVLTILIWSVEKNTGRSILPSSPTDSSQEPASTTPSPSSISPSTKTSPVIPQVQDTGNNDTLSGKWRMVQQQFQSSIPKEVPDFIVNTTFPQKSTWEISRDNGQCQIQFDGRDTWYKKTFLNKVITEGKTSVQASPDGLSCTFVTPAQFYMKSLPLIIGLLFGDISEIKGTFTSTVVVTASGDKLKATASISNVKGTYRKEHKDGKKTTDSINFSGVKATYQGTKK